MERYIVMLKKAEEEGACEDAMEHLWRFRSFEAASSHPDAAEWGYWYANYVIGGRWPEVEAIIAKSAEYAYYYALYVIKGRWYEAEPTLAEDAGWAYCYARYVIKGDWPEADIKL